MTNELELAVAIANELAAIDGYDASDQHCGLYDLRWSGGPNLEPLGDAWTMDYLPKGERIAAALRSVEQPAWIRVVDEALVVAHLCVASVGDDFATAREKLGTLIDWHVAVATDPKVNGGFELRKVEQPRAPEPVTDELIDEAVNCAWHVAGTNLHSREDIKAAVKAIYPMFVGRAFPPAPRSDDAPRELKQQCFREDDPERFGYVIGWNACRDAMLTQRWLATAASSEAAQEPVGEVKDNPDDIGTYVDLERSLPIGTKLYTHPAPLRPVTDGDAQHASEVYFSVLAQRSAQGASDYNENVICMRAALESFCSRLAGEDA